MLAIYKTFTDGEALANYLDERVANLIKEVFEWKGFVDLFDSKTPIAFIKEVLKEVHLEVAQYNNDIIEANIAIIGQLPRSMDIDIIEELLHHQAEEFHHGELAANDYIALGGDKENLHGSLSSSAFAIAAVRRLLVQKRDWASWLGGLYVIEASTPIITERVQSLLAARGAAGNGTSFIDEHVVADIEHREILRRLIVRIANDYPNSHSAMAYGPEYYLHVYPLPSWQAAINRAKQQFRD